MISQRCARLLAMLGALGVAVEASEQHRAKPQLAVLDPEVEVRLASGIGLRDRLVLVFLAEKSSPEVVSYLGPNAPSEEVARAAEWLRSLIQEPRVLRCDSEVPIAESAMRHFSASTPQLGTRLRVAALSSPCPAMRKAAVEGLLEPGEIDRAAQYGWEIATALKSAEPSRRELSLLARVALPEETRMQLLEDPRLTMAERAYLGDAEAEQSLIKAFWSAAGDTETLRHSTGELSRKAIDLLFLRNDLGKRTLEQALSSPVVYRDRKCEKALAYFVLQLWFTAHRSDRLALGVDRFYVYDACSPEALRAPQGREFLTSLERYFRDSYGM
jgi:hypothetical protein